MKRDPFLWLFGKCFTVKGFTTMEARLNYLDYVQDWPVYGVTYFEVQQRQFKDYPSPLLLGITCEGALLIHPDNRVCILISYVSRVVCGPVIWCMVLTPARVCVVSSVYLG